MNSNLMNLETLDELGKVVFWTPSGYAYHLWTECGYLKCAKKIYGGTANLLPPDRSLCKGCGLEFNLYPPPQALSAGPCPFTTFYIPSSVGCPNDANLRTRLGCLPRPQSSFFLL